MQAKLGASRVLNVSCSRELTPTAAITEILLDGDENVKEVFYHGMGNQLKRIPSVGPKLAGNLARAGYKSIAEIAQAVNVDFEKYKGIGPKKARNLVKRAQAITEKKFIPIKSPTKLPDKEKVILFDIETGYKGKYIWAICAQLPNGQIYQWYANNRAEESMMLQEFNVWLRKIIAEEPKSVLGCWSGTKYDFRVLYERASNSLRETLSKYEQVDFVKLTKNHVACPTDGFKLKELAAYLGYKFSEHVDGLEVAMTYVEYEWKGGLPDKIRESYLKYNREDVLSFRFLLDETIYNDKLFREME